MNWKTWWQKFGYQAIYGAVASVLAAAIMAAQSLPAGWKYAWIGPLAVVALNQVANWWKHRAPKTN